MEGQRKDGRRGEGVIEKEGKGKVRNCCECPFITQQKIPFFSHPPTAGRLRSSSPSSKKKVKKHPRIDSRLSCLSSFHSSRRRRHIVSFSLFMVSIPPFFIFPNRAFSFFLSLLLLFFSTPADHAQGNR